MNEPKKDLIIAAAKKAYPACDAVTINHRKHIATLIRFGKRGVRGHKLEVKANSHRQLLDTFLAGVMTP